MAGLAALLPGWLPGRAPRGPPPPARVDAAALARDGAALVALMAFVPALRYVLHVLVYEPVARAVLATPAPKARPPPPSADPRERRVQKFSESAWKLTVYIALLATGVAALAPAPWLTSFDDLWRGWPHTAPLPRRLATYYFSEGAFYAASTFMLIWWEVRRADFGAMLAHHLATGALIAGSHVLKYHRVGSLVMLLHDPSDVLLEAAKLASYAGWEVVAGCLFAGLAASWAVLRLVLLPRVVYSALVDAPRILHGPPLGSRPLAAALAVLVVLHAYWFALIVRVGVNSVTGRGLRDARETDDGGGTAAVTSAVSTPAPPARTPPRRRSTRARK